MTMSSITSVTAIGLILFAAGASAAERTPPGTSSLPDWSGAWINISGLTFTSPGSFRPVPGAETNPAPLTPEYAKKQKELLAADPTKAVGGGNGCVFPALPAANLSPMPKEFLITRDRVGILDEASATWRLIYTDGRKVPEDHDPSYQGFSIGHWEGDTLVVDTVGLRSASLFPGVDHSDQMTLRERIRKVAPDVLENEITMTDPVIFTRPYVAKVQFRRMDPNKPGSRLIEYVCTDNNRNPVGADGTVYTLDQNGKILTGPAQ